MGENWPVRARLLIFQVHLPSVPRHMVEYCLCLLWLNRLIATPLIGNRYSALPYQFESAQPYALFRMAHVLAKAAGVFVAIAWVKWVEEASFKPHFLISPRLGRPRLGSKFDQHARIIVRYIELSGRPCRPFCLMGSARGSAANKDTSHGVALFGYGIRRGPDRAADQFTGDVVGKACRSA